MNPEGKNVSSTSIGVSALNVSVALPFSSGSVVSIITYLFLETKNVLGISGRLIKPVTVILRPLAPCVPVNGSVKLVSCTKHTWFPAIPSINCPPPPSPANVLHTCAYGLLVKICCAGSKAITKPLEPTKLMFLAWKASPIKNMSQCSLSNKNSIVVPSGILCANGLGSPLSSTMLIV